MYPSIPCCWVRISPPSGLFWAVGFIITGEEMKGTISSIIREWDSAMCKYYWVVQIETEETPTLKVGECEVKQ